MATFIAKDETAFSLQLNTFADKIDQYKAALGIAQAKVDSVKADRNIYDFILGLNDQVQTYAQGFTSYKKLLRFGNDNEVLGAVPVLTFPVPPFPPLVAANIDKRFRDLVQDCAASPNFNDTIGQDLGIVAPFVPFDPATGKPVFTIELSTGGYPLLKWKKIKFQGVEIWKDAGDGAGWKKHDRDMRPDYIDKSNLPPVGISKVWKYKMIYLVDDEVVGNWSDELSVTVYGEV
jgi:hypothetical protein